MRPSPWSLLSVGDVSEYGLSESLGFDFELGFLSLCRRVRGGVGGRCFLGCVGGDGSRCVGERGSVSVREGPRGMKGSGSSGGGGRGLFMSRSVKVDFGDGRGYREKAGSDGLGTTGLEGAAFEELGGLFLISFPCLAFGGGGFFFASDPSPTSLARSSSDIDISWDVRGVSGCTVGKGSKIDCRDTDAVSVLLLLSLMPPGWEGGPCDGEAGRFEAVLGGRLDVPVSSNLLKASTSIEGLLEWLVTGFPSGRRLGPPANFANVAFTGSTSTCLLPFIESGLLTRILRFFLVFNATSSSSWSSPSEASALKGSSGEPSSELAKSLSAPGYGDPSGCVRRGSTGEVFGVGLALMRGVSGEIGTGGDAMRTVFGLGDGRGVVAWVSQYRALLGMMRKPTFDSQWRESLSGPGYLIRDGECGVCQGRSRRGVAVGRSPMAERI